MRTVKNIEPGTRFGRLVVLERDYEYETWRRAVGKKSNHRHYRCNCDCGGTTVVDMYCLLRGTTTSCGCVKRERLMKKGRKVKDLTGIVYGHMTVIELDSSKPYGAGRHAYWICKCGLCGNVKSVRSSDLTMGAVTHCGCQTSYMISKRTTTDLNGKIFGHLTVVDRDYSTGFHSGCHAKWNCVCGLCGRVESVASDMLTSYGKDRCSICAKAIPIGELRIMELLDEMGVEYIHETSSLGCRYPETESLLYFDFVVNPNTDATYIIEFDGIQHFKEVKRWERSMSLEERQKRDAYKNKWCIDKGIPLIRIPYTVLKNISVDDVNLLTSSFVIEGGGLSA